MLRVLAQNGYDHQYVSGYSSPEPGHVTLPGPHRVASLLKRWNAGTHHYRVEREHLQYYLDEFAFRFNRRRSRARGLLFYRLLQQSVNTDPHPLADLIGGTAENLPDDASCATRRSIGRRRDRSVHSSTSTAAYAPQPWYALVPIVSIMAFQAGVSLVTSRFAHR
jgi:hypothetical protein